MMEEELHCPTCKQLFVNPVLLPCYHAICLGCALEIQTPCGPSTSVASTGTAASVSGGSCTNVNALQHSLNAIHISATQHPTLNTHTASTRHSSHSSASSTTSSATGSESISSEQDQADKLSILSEADSGVVCYSHTHPSRPVSFTAAAAATAVYCLICPVCGKVIHFDEQGVRNLPAYRVMESIIDRFCAREALRCQMCEKEPKVATLICEQCEICYCDACRELCHPARGPLAKHTLIKPENATQRRESLCAEHMDCLVIFCQDCRVPACEQCLSLQRHAGHEVQAIVSACKTQKTELSHNLQQLSEKARSTTEFIQRLKGMSDKVTESCLEFEGLVISQCEQLISLIKERREYLLEAIRMDRDTKIRILKEQQCNCTGKLQQTTGLIQFCIEALKETDSAAFLQVGSMLINRVANTDITWKQEVKNAAPRVAPIVDLTLDDAALVRAIENLHFKQMKLKDEQERLPAGSSTFIPTTATVAGGVPPPITTAALTIYKYLVPLKPLIKAEECSAVNNSVTVAWQALNHSRVEGYVLELDDGCGGDFREVYCGKETICTVDGLHFNSMYNARVKAFNSTGEGEYSELIGLQTAEVAWFSFDPILSGGPGSGLVFSNNNSTVTLDGWEHRVALGSVGFSRGVHYWAFTLDHYTPDTDPAFGVARIDVNRNKMLGKDDKAFAMYIDHHRSWFQHNSVHERRVEGGITTGSTIGVLLDLDRHTLSFLVNEVPQGSVAFRDLYGVFYPAVSINRGITLTLHTALEAPKMDYF